MRRGALVKVHSLELGGTRVLSPLSPLRVLSAPTLRASSTHRQAASKTGNSEQMAFDQLFSEMSLLIIRATLTGIISPRPGPNYKADPERPPQNHHCVLASGRGRITGSAEVSTDERVTQLRRCGPARAEL